MHRVRRTPSRIALLDPPPTLISRHLQKMKYSLKPRRTAGRLHASSLRSTKETEVEYHAAPERHSLPRQVDSELFTPLDAFEKPRIVGAVVLVGNEQHRHELIDRQPQGAVRPRQRQGEGRLPSPDTTRDQVDLGRGALGATAQFGLAFGVLAVDAGSLGLAM